METELLFSLTPHVDMDGASRQDSHPGYTASSVTLNFGIFSENAEVKPLFPKHRVGKPIAVMAEGEYYTKRGGKYVKAVFTREDIERVAKVQPRDVPFNYDHKRVTGKEGVKGWLRFGEGLSFAREVQTSEGPKMMLFATPELNEEAVDMVVNGVYRDVSAEVRPWDKVMTGIALTSYPVMRNLQFSEVAGEEEEIESSPSVVEIVRTTEEHPQQEQEAEVADTNESDKAQVEEAMEPDKLLESIKGMDEDKRKELSRELLSAMGVDVEGIVKMSEKLEKDREAVLTEKAKNTISAALGEDHYGLSDELASDCVDVLVWSEKNSTLNFGEEGGAPDLQGVISGLLEAVAKSGKRLKALAGESSAIDGNGSELFGEIDPDIEVKDEVGERQAEDILARARALL